LPVSSAVRSDVRASTINEEMNLAAARAIAAIIPDDELDPEYVIPERSSRDVASAVAEAAQASGVARRRRRPASGDACLSPLRARDTVPARVASGARLPTPQRSGR
jgi:malic enzyme